MDFLFSDQIILLFVISFAIVFFSLEILPLEVTALGSVGLQALNLLLGTKYQLKNKVAQCLSTPNFILFPLYHPSPRVTNWMRPLAQQKKDFKKIPCSTISI